MKDKVKRIFSILTASCFSLVTFSFANPVKVMAEGDEPPSFLSGIEINATVGNSYSDAEKFD